MPQALNINHLAKSYGSVRALDDVTFSVAPGEIFGFVGSNGAGKSTTMRIVLGVLAADSGDVRLGDAPIDFDGRKRIGYMPEERGLYPKMKVGDQLAYLARLHGLSKSEAADATEKWTRRLGIHGRLGDQVNDLSLGNQQRVQLAAALVHDPDLLVLDEPFSGLDPVAVDVMSEVLTDKAAQGIPVIFSSHQLDLVERLCDRVGVVSGGVMKALGTVDDLRARDGLRLEVRGPRSETRWADGLPGVTDVEYRDASAVLHIDHGTDDQQILTAAMAAGPVHRFATTAPSLTELFRELV
ncbi:ABC transporter ATP-binding protein [Gordonia sihwensis]|uniref:ABC transporter ATP-binding protein n=1 Tax=Gordonia sihwensis TaxID=173559 RepID=UPI001C9317C4|nr:ATP-binding cassette domain-containing protein [Gordonia sihwensis]MBY4571622.1 ABC transporter ATP-binding protein [Gordonia sihwensis]